MEKWWDCSQLDEFCSRILRADLESKIRSNRSLVLEIILVKLFNSQSPSRSFIHGQKHYDLGNVLFENMLDKRMVYSLRILKDASSLDESQEKKLDISCRKINLNPECMYWISDAVGKFCKVCS
jgi:cyclopropane-fatty-acyl-phospholipid synthase